MVLEMAKTSASWVKLQWSKVVTAIKWHLVQRKPVQLDDRTDSKLSNFKTEVSYVQVSCFCPPPSTQSIVLSVCGLNILSILLTVCQIFTNLYKKYQLAILELTFVCGTVAHLQQRTNDCISGIRVSICLWYESMLCSLENNWHRVKWIAYFSVFT